jgi:uncharacterized membrane protein YphA (DoxX/SURF4 family)
MPQLEPGGAAAVPAPAGPAAPWLSLVLRLALGIPWLAAAIAVLAPGGPAVRAAESWLAAKALLLPAPVHAVAAGAVALALLAGWRTRLAAAAAVGVALALHAEWLLVDPTYPPLQHVLPFLALALALGWTAAAGDRVGLDGLRRIGTRPGPDARATALLALRLFLGALFVAQGWRDLTAPGGPIGFARAAYVEPYRGTILPVPLLWAAGVTNPLVQLATGAALLAGLRTRLAALAAAAFLVTIVLGHAVADPFNVAADLHQYALQNLAAAIVVAALAPSRRAGAAA